MININDYMKWAVYFHGHRCPAMPLVLLFSFKGEIILLKPLTILWIAIPFFIQNVAKLFNTNITTRKGFLPFHIRIISKFLKLP